MKSHLCISSAIAAGLAASACTSARHASNAPLPIERHPPGTEWIVSARADRTHDHLHVAGSARPRTGQSFAHVEIQALDENGAILAETTEDLHPAQPAPGGGRRRLDSYLASFPGSIAQRTASVRVIYRAGSHANCNEG